MKKLIFLVCILFASVMANAQVPTQNFMAPYWISSTTTNFTHSLPKGTIVYGNFILPVITNTVVGTGYNYTTMIAAGKAVLQSSAVTDSSYVHTTGSDIAYGNYIFYGSVTATITGHSSLDLPLTGGTVSGSTTFSLLPSFTIAAGTLTPIINADTIGTAISGLTTSSIVMLNYSAFHASPDTLPYAVCKTGWLTVHGKRNFAVNYWIPKK